MPKASGMTVRDIYELAVALGRKADPRGDERVAEILEAETKAYEELSDAKKGLFDKEALANPYPDTRILNGDEKTEVKTVLAGIDMGTAEILLADRLSEKGTKIDAVMSHHPEGKAMWRLDAQVKMQSDLLTNYGMPVHIAESLTEKRVTELGRMFSPMNFNQAIDTAKLLNIPFICTHTATDNLVYQFLKQHIMSKKPKTVDDIMNALMELPEYQEATRLGAGPRIFTGHSERRVGKVAFAEITGGTSGAKETYDYLSRNGIGTIISMHMKEEYREAADAAHLNMIIAGHMSSDSLGMNLMLDHLEAAGIKVIPTSGLIRVSRQAVEPTIFNSSIDTNHKKGAR